MKIQFKNKIKGRLLTAVEAATLKHDSAVVTSLTADRVLVRNVAPKLRAEMVFTVWNTAKGSQLKAAVREDDSSDPLVFLRGKPLRNRIQKEYPASAAKLIAFLNTII